jgi:hypothetical protein
MPCRCHNAGQRRQRSQRFEQPHTAPTVEPCAKERKDCDQEEKVALQDAKRARVFVQEVLHVKRTDNQRNAQQGKQNQQGALAAQHRIVVIHGLFG